MVQNPENFRLQAYKLFFTYARCDEPIDDLYEFINARYPIKYGIFACEHHADGALHIHAAVEFKKRIDIKDSRRFDFRGHHPNFAKPKNWAASKQYCKKEGFEIREFGQTEADKDDIYLLPKLALELDHDDYYLHCLRNSIPIGYADKFWKKRKSIFTITTSPIFEEPRIREDLAAREIELSDRRAIHIIGPSGIGKTTWAIEHCEKPALLVSHMDGLKELNPEHKSIIFDDMAFAYLPREAQIAIVDREQPRAIHVRYGTVSVKAGIQKIFTSNVDIFTVDDAINRRVNRINFY